MSKLTLPIVADKKYVRRDGKADVVSKIEGGLFILPSGENGYTSTGKCSSFGRDCPADLVSDYIEPAKGHPHAALMAEFAKDAAESETPWDRWEHAGSNGIWRPVERCAPTWEPWIQWRRRPAVTPHPHAASAAEYAKDMAETDKAWERWEAKGPSFIDWKDCLGHPSWYHDFQYRRRPL